MSLLNVLCIHVRIYMYNNVIYCSSKEEEKKGTMSDVVTKLMKSISQSYTNRLLNKKALDFH